MKTLTLAALLFTACADPTLGTWAGQTVADTECSDGTTSREVNETTVTLTEDTFTATAPLTLCQDISRDDGALRPKACGTFSLRDGPHTLSLLGGAVGVVQVDGEERLQLSVDLQAEGSDTCTTTVVGLLRRGAP